MKKMFLATCLLAASVFAAPSAEDVKAATEKPAVEAKTTVTKTKTTAVKKKAKVKAKAEKAAEDTKATAVATDAKAQEAAKAPEAAKAAATDAKTEAKAAVAEKKPAVDAKKTQESAKAVEAKAEKAAAEVKAQEATKAPEAAKAEAKVEETVKAEPAPAAEVKAPEAAKVEPAPAPAPVAAPVAEPKVEETAKTEAAPAVQVPTAVEASSEPAATEPASTSGRKKKKMIENAVFTVNEIDFGINADFELEAGKVFWRSETDENSDNFETWNGQANLAILAETNNFKGKIALAFYPGDLKTDNVNGETGSVEDYFSLDEAWAYQSKNWFSFKVGRWDNTDKNGDYFGGYIDGYLNGFLSTQDPENQFEFGFAPIENIDFALSFISKSTHLNKGDFRFVFNVHDIPSIELLEFQLGYRSNVFDKVHDSKAKIHHNTSFKVRASVIPDFFTAFGEVGLLDMSDDLAVPFTLGMEFNFKTVDRVILEAECLSNRRKHGYFEGHPKHVKALLGAIYVEKALTDRFSLSAGYHSYGSTKDFMLSGNLVGRIN
jgi:hypothetical protein